MNKCGWPHLMVSGFGCDSKLLNSVSVIYDLLDKLPNTIGMKKLTPPFICRVSEEDHEDVGITAVVIIATSHISIHTFPFGQKNNTGTPKLTDGAFFTFDCYSCKNFYPEDVEKELVRILKPTTLEMRTINRLTESHPVVV